MPGKTDERPVSAYGQASSPHEPREAYNRFVDAALERIDPKRRRLVAMVGLAGIALLQLVTEYLGTRDAARFVSKAITLAVGLPLLVAGGFGSLARRSLQRFALGPLFLGAVAAGLFFAVLLFVTRAATQSLVSSPGTAEPWGEGDVLRVGFAMGLTYFGIWALAFVFPAVAEDARVRSLEAERLRTQVELARLRSHLEPHFLLNTLNAIAGLVMEDPQKARQLIGTLGDLLRDSVNPSDEMQTLGEQVEWLQRYARILEERHAGNLAFHWEIAGDTRAARVPRLLLQPLVENAVKHGALMRAGGGEISVRTEALDGRLICTVEDNGPGFPNAPARPGAFGLTSVRGRLALQYSNDGTLRIESLPGRTKAIVELPLERGSTS